MTKKVKIKEINNKVKNFDGYITKIESIAGKIKDVVIEATIKKLKIYEKEDIILVLMNIEDETDNITALLMNERDLEFKMLVKKLEVNNKYRIRGNVLMDNEEISQEYFSLAQEELNEDKLLFITSIGNINSKRLINKKDEKEDY